MSPNKIGYVEFYECCNNDAKTKSEAESLINALEHFEFFVGMVVWYYIYFSINTVSKKLRSKSMCINATRKRLGNMSYFEKYRKVCFTKSAILQKMLHLK